MARPGQGLQARLPKSHPAEGALRRSVCRFGSVQVEATIIAMLLANISAVRPTRGI